MSKEKAKVLKNVVSVLTILTIYFVRVFEIRVWSKTYIKSSNKYSKNVFIQLGILIYSYILALGIYKIGEDVINTIEDKTKKEEKEIITE